MNKWAELLIGLILLNGTILVAYFSQNWVWLNTSWNFWTPAWIFFKGGLVWFLLMIGILFILLGISDMKE